MKPRTAIHWLLLFALVSIWGSSFALTKIAVAVFSPEVLVAWRLVIGSCILIVPVLIFRRVLPLRPGLWSFYLTMAVVGGCLPFWLISWGQSSIDSGLAGILMAIMPPATMILAHFFVAGERLNPAKAIGFLIAFIGIVILMGPDLLLEVSGVGTALIAQLAVAGAAMCYSVAAILARVGPKSDSISRSFGVTLIGAAIMMPLAEISGTPWDMEIDMFAAVALAMLGVLSTGVATVIYFRLISEAGPTFLSLINYLIPLWAVALGAIAFGEELSWHALVALFIVLCGIAISESSGKLSHYRTSHE